MFSDIRVGRLMAAAAVRGALENVAINLESITDSEFASGCARNPRLLRHASGKSRWRQPLKLIIEGQP